MSKNDAIVNALTGDDALVAEVGEKVLFIHAQANRDSKIHLIGGHGDLVWQGGSFGDPPTTNLETWSVPRGTAVAMLYQFRNGTLAIRPWWTRSSTGLYTSLIKLN